LDASANTIVEKVPVLTIHSLVGTGANCLTRVVAALPNTFVLNEVSPAGHKLAMSRFNAIDPLEQSFVKKTDRLVLSEQQHCELFANRLHPIIDHCRERKLVLVIRDFSHADYFFDKSPNSPTLPKALALLEDHIDIRSVMFVRFPFASFLSAKANRLIDSVPQYEDYCTRYMDFVNDYVGVPRIRYEDYTMSPQATLQKLCRDMDLTFSDDALRKFSDVELTGSKRYYHGDRVIHPTLLRDFGPVIRKDAIASKAGRELSALLSYPFDPAEFARNAAERVLRFEPGSSIAQDAYDKWSALLAEVDNHKEASK